MAKAKSMKKLREEVAKIEDEWLHFGDVNVRNYSGTERLLVLVKELAEVIDPLPKKKEDK